MASLTSFAFSSLPPSRSPPLLLSESKMGRCGRDAVFVAAMPLRAAAGPPQFAVSAAYSLGLWELQHFMVAVRPSDQSQVFIFDFQPQDPESFGAAVMAISGRSLPGTILKRKLSRIPKTRCWFVGFSLSDGLEIAEKFNEEWSSDLVIGKNDCRHYANGLVKSLTGKDNILEKLRANFVH